MAETRYLYESGKTAGFAKIFNRTSGIPLERTQLFDSLEDAQNYAKGDNTDYRKLGSTKFIGQLLTVYQPAADGKSEILKVYIVNSNNGLTEVGKDTDLSSYVLKTTTINGKALTGNITLNASDVGLENVANISPDEYFTNLASDTTNAVQITVGGETKNITVATLKTSLGLQALAYKSSLSYSDVGALAANGTANKALALSLTKAIGDSKTPVYFNANGEPVALNYTIEKSVPSSAIFTDENVKVNALSDSFDTTQYLVFASNTGTGALNIRNTSSDSVYVKKDSTGNTNLYANTFVGSLSGTATTATNLTTAPTVTNSTDSKDIIITVGGKSSSNIRIPYATNSLHAKGAEEAEYSSLSGKAETLDWDPVTNEIIINFGFSIGSSSEIDTNLLESETVTILDKNKYNTVFISPTKESSSVGYFIVQFSENNSKYEIISIKSNGFNIPTGTTTNGVISLNQLPKDSIIENLEVIIRTL